ncbi:Fic family protein [Burkholderia ubonensis]|uniref:Fic family protein n=2 Tax=Burkholderia ubonensis TaxID=101571 RepID=UPI00075F3ED7|nr:Fic family protein [Burkholderia ubonensis]KVD56344.1 cell filamentation protein Fic [Burkholderia ubonensis]KVD71983.1 cell filamentation protein Fic [Burkholderia ubonensis]KVG29410.1 cell filamentation protein Fic [Burkholderia ubonensis]KVP02310.1 cell filamentation protein Fic [Burkholderia ubonensis]KVP51819.1 cell filamentation protein Fic [Burkholderia ubonensis]
MTTIVSFEPLFPEDRMLDPLLERTAELVGSSQQLLAVRGTPLGAALVPQLRAMNSYYTNKIEGQHTTPAKIEAALRRDYSTDLVERKKQRFAIAHIATEAALEEEWGALSVPALFDPMRISTLHARFFSLLPADERITGEGHPIVPGEFRKTDVTVGRHLAPEPEMIEPLLAAWATRYARIRAKEYQLIGIACSHHRLTWVHPFMDGNGRVARLHSHLGLRAAGLTHGLWSPLRGLAREHGQYYATLSEADQSRRNDLDGRGSLSQEGLVQFARFFLDCCLDQVSFMIRMTDFDGVAGRMLDLLRYLDANPWTIGSEKSVIKPEASALAMEFVMLRRTVTRAEFTQMLGVSDVLARRIARSLLDFGLLGSPSHRGELSFRLPLRSLRFLFPRLWPEVDQE